MKTSLRRPALGIALLGIALVCLVLVACSDTRSQSQASGSKPQASGGNPPSIQIISERRPFDIDSGIAQLRKSHQMCLEARWLIKKIPYSPRDIMSTEDARKLGSGVVEEYFQGADYARFETFYELPTFSENYNEDDCKFNVEDRLARTAQIIRGCKTLMFNDAEKRITELVFSAAACAIGNRKYDPPRFTNRKAMVAGHECTYQDMTPQPAPGKCFLSAYPTYPVGKDVILTDDIETGKATFPLSLAVVANKVVVGQTIPKERFEVPAWAAGYPKDTTN